MSVYDREPLYVISVAARLLEMHAQTLRKYEREGFIEPSRTRGRLRLYSAADIERLRQIKYLVDQRGLNLAGVQLALELTRRLREVRASYASTDQTGSNGADGGGDLRRELDGVLAMLGFIDEPSARRRDP